MSKKQPLATAGNPAYAKKRQSKLLDREERREVPNALFCSQVYLHPSLFSSETRRAA